MEKIPVSSPDIGPIELDLINQVLRTPYLSVGPMIERFEQAVATYLGVRHGVAISSGTAGLHLAIIATECAREQSTKDLKRSALKSFRRRNSDHRQ